MIGISVRTTACDGSNCRANSAIWIYSLRCAKSELLPKSFDGHAYAHALAITTRCTHPPRSSH